MRAGVMAAWLLLLLGVWPLGAMAQSGQVSCSSFPNQAAAQAAYRANPAALASLDRDRDGVACESLPCPCDPPRAATSNGSASGSPPANPTSAPAYVFAAPTLPPQPTGIPSSARAAPRPREANPAPSAPAAVASLAGPLPPAPPREVPADPPSGAPAGAFADLADLWTGRDGVLVVQADGLAQALWWAPRVCPAGAGGCDPAAELTGRASLALRWRDESRIVAEVEMTTHEGVLPLGVAILRLRPDGVLELWVAGQEGRRAYCTERLWREQPAVAREACGGEVPTLRGPW